MRQKQLIDIIAPSSPPKDTKWKKGIQILESWGFKVRFSDLALSPHSFHANSNQKRAFFLNKAFSSKDSSIVWMLRGGYGFQKLMPSFIKTYSKKNKKLFVGYSDGTALHVYLNHHNKRTLHAPTVSELADLSKKELNLLEKVLLFPENKIIFRNLKLFKKSAPKKLKAKIIGGNLSLLSSSVGTSWLSSFKSSFLFLEDVNEEAYKLDRMLHHLFYSGSLKSVKAILFGDFYPLSQKSFLTVLKSFSKTSSIPFIFNVPVGHKRKQSLALGVSAELSFKAGKADLILN